MKQNNIYLIFICLFFFFSCDSKRAILPSAALHSGDRLFSEAEAQLAGHFHEKAMGLYREYLVQFPRGPRASGALMKIGIIHMFNENYKLARDVFNNLIAQFPESEFFFDAKNKMLETYYAEGSFWKVIEQGSEVLKTAVLKKDLKKTYTLLAEAYSTIGFEEKAAYYYYMAYDHSMAKEKDSMVVKLKEYLSGKDTSQNILLKSGDVLFVPFNDHANSIGLTSGEYNSHQVIVYGFVNRNSGSNTFKYYNGYTARDYIAMAGGTKEQGASFRSGNINRTRIYRSSGVKINNALDELVQPGDMIEVPPSMLYQIVGRDGIIRTLASIASSAYIIYKFTEAK